jgi:hypothetical protein
MTNEQLQKFCSRHLSQSIAQPFTDGEWTYASNGYVLIRVPVTTPMPWRDNQPRNLWTLIPDRCNVVPCELPPRWNDRELPVIDCRECGTGDMPGNGVCEYCDGTGKTEGRFPIPVNRECSASVDLKHLRLVHELPGVKLFRQRGKGPIRVEFDGGDGAMATLYMGGQTYKEKLAAQWT